MPDPRDKPPLDVNALLTFARVVEAGGFTGAGARLGLPKQTVSRRVAALEGALGVRLVERTSRGVRPTETGRALYDRATRIVTELDEISAALAEDRGAVRGLLRVTAPQLLGTTVLGPIVSEYLDRYPEARVEVVLSQRSEPLAEGSFDLAIRSSAVTGASLMVRKLGATPLLLCASPRYLERRPALRDPEELAGHTWVLYNEGRTRQTFRLRRGAEEREVRVQGRLGAGSIEIAMRAALGGLGVLCAPAFALTAQLAAGALTRVLPEWELPVGVLYAVYPGHKHVPPKVRAFIDLLSARLAEAIR